MCFLRRMPPLYRDDDVTFLPCARVCVPVQTVINPITDLARMLEAMFNVYPEVKPEAIY